MGGLIIAYDCGTHELMEGKTSPYEVPKFKLGFRSKAHLGIDNIALALYIKKNYPNIKKIAGINQDCLGRIAGSFLKAMKKSPQVQVLKTLWPPQQYRFHSPYQPIDGAGPISSIHPSGEEMRSPSRNRH
jgi:hypothetical protein